MAGQTELTGQQRRSLAEDGYLLVPSVLAAEAAGALTARLDGLARAIIAEWDATPGTQPEEAGVVSIRLDPADPWYALRVSMGYRGRREGGFMGKQLAPTVQQRSPGMASASGGPSQPAAVAADRPAASRLPRFRLGVRADRRAAVFRQM